MHQPRRSHSLLAFFLRLLLRLLYRVEMRGQLQPSDRLLIVCNHESFLDAVLLSAFLPVSPLFAVHTTIAAKWYFRAVLRLARHVVVDAAKPIALKTLISAVESGEPVMIFPEGRVTVTGSLMKIYDGPAFVAARSGCTVVPVQIEGTLYSPFSRMGADFPRKLFPRIRITIHEGVKLPMPDAPMARQRRRLASERLRRLMQECTFASRRRTSLFDAFIDAAELYGFRRGVLGDISTTFDPVSYRAILKGSLALGRLVSKVTADREIVGVLMPNVNATVYLLFGLAAFRRIPAMLNFTSGVEGLRNACHVAKVRTVLTSRAFLERAKLEDTVSRLSGVKLVCLEDLRAQFTLRDKLWLMSWALWNPRRVRRPVRGEDAALVLFTSGSEGVPKGVVLSHNSLLANVAQINAAYAYSCRDRFMSALPLFHAFGITGGILVPLLKGCRVVLYPTPLHYRLVPEFIYDRDCTVLFTTNTFLRKYAQVAHRYDFYSLRHLLVGAEKLSDDVRQLCIDKFGVRPLEGYGATECSPAIAISSTMANQPGSVGEILPGMEYRIEPVEGLHDGGVLHVRGENVMLGYLKGDQPGIVQPVESIYGSGWYSTGDVVTVSDSYITIQARLKRFAKVAGEMVSLEQVERIAAEAEPSRLHAAVAYAEKARGEGIAVFTTDQGLQREHLKAAARRLGAPEIALPRRIVYLEKIPLLANGKTDYVSLSRMAADIVSRPVSA